MVQIVCAIGERFFFCKTSVEFVKSRNYFVALLAILMEGVLTQRNKPSCYKYWVEDPDTIDQVYFPYKGL